MSENLKKVDEILKIDNKLEDFLILCETIVTNKIKDFCNIDNIPERINPLIQEFLIEQHTLNKNGIGEGIKEVTSAKDREQTVNFETIGGAKVISKNADEFIERNATTLVSYRKMRW